MMPSVTFPTTKAALLELLPGLAIGGLGGAAAGRLAYSPKKPTEWLDEENRFQSRDLTKEERKDRLGLAIRGAVLGASLGGLASVGGGMYRRGVLNKGEQAEISEVLTERLEGLRSLHKDAGKQKIIYRDGRVELWPSAKARQTKIQGLIENETKAIKGLADEVIERRRGRPWGGWLKSGGDNPVPHEELTLSGAVSRRFKNLRRDKNLPPFVSPMDREAPGKKFWRNLLEKTSSVSQVAFAVELDKLAFLMPFGVFRKLKPPPPPPTALQRAKGMVWDNRGQLIKAKDVYEMREDIPPEQEEGNG